MSENDVVVFRHGDAVIGQRDGEWYTQGDLHMLCVVMAKELVRVRRQHKLATAALKLLRKKVAEKCRDLLEEV